MRKKQKINFNNLLLISAIILIVITFVTIYLSNFHSATGYALASLTCSDTDGGIKRITLGTVTGTDSNGQAYSYTDQCIDSATLLEYSCSNNNVVTQNIVCNTGQSMCQNGACINITLAQPTCGDGLCQTGESCEWNGAQRRQMLCDGMQTAIPTGSSCQNCVYTPASSAPPAPTPSCGNNIVETGEECETGQTSSTSCGSNIGICTVGTKVRSCTAQCTWGSYGNCDGASATTETCDGLDNDCDGQTDEGNVCPTENPCGNDVCDNGETTATCPQDCTPPTSSTAFCGNTLCEQGETSASCPTDCSSAVVNLCGNFYCDNGETVTTCPTDCTTYTSSACGDFICDSTETIDTCPTDCSSAYAGTYASTCGNFICDFDETAETCSTDCTSQTSTGCGDSVCDPTENSATCPADCALPSTTCGDGICDQGESCEWNAQETRQILCDGQNGKLAEGSSCVRCVYTLPQNNKPACGDNICNADELTTCSKDCEKVIQLEKRRSWCNFLKFITVGILDYDACVAKGF